MSHNKAISALQFFTDKFDDYWHLLYKITPRDDRKTDNFLYFYDISPKAIQNRYPLDKNGVYLFLGYDKKYHYHALEIAQYALACWLAWRKTHRSKWLSLAITNCNWLLSNQGKRGEWQIQHTNPRFDDLESPWISGMAQGLSISALLRYYSYTNNPKILECCENAIQVLENNIESGGVKRHFGNNFIYEEYPRKKLSGVLNGYITALISIIELTQKTNTYKNLKYDNLQNLSEIIDRFDTSFWSLYSLDGSIASGFYHRYHIIQLRSLGFEDHALKFEKYTHNIFFKCKAFRLKIKNENYTNNIYEK